MSRDIELEKQIDAYIKGHLNEDQAQELWEKLLQHPEYLELLNTELGVQSLIADPANTSPEQKDHHALIHSLQNSWKWVAAVAAAVVVAIAFNYFSFHEEPSLRELALNEIILSENLASAPTIRSQQHQLTPGDSLLNLGFKAALSGNLSEAVAYYNTIIREYPQQPAAVQAYLNKGIIRFNQQDYKVAIASFNEAIDRAEEHSFTREKAYWYMGNTYIKTDSLEQARTAISEVYSMKGIYRNPAGDLLKELDNQLNRPE
ncbi:tetratricopeptide repeat protein [Fodinibius sediminis]|uniref:Tetratricopeptide repeat-containing protein n=1 Tax=Fodinibius sediminis TaxID=1214077 RepID=A0A521BHB2_9BACT|nr:tetratricopeptide repeat protein [Fodinibius sediminis]SMO46462.1 Tetratricopeptide repeat-containing protein [Fodinibius sediminis]